MLWPQNNNNNDDDDNNNNEMNLALERLGIHDGPHTTQSIYYHATRYVHIRIGKKQRKGKFGKKI